MAVSFYKMFGYPTGVGALIVKKEFLEWLSRGPDGGGSFTGGSKVWFAGGTVDVVQVPGKVFTLAAKVHERFEVGFHSANNHFMPV
jgi:selenocysteine lyase/cysteine desulfurase